MSDLTHNDIQPYQAPPELVRALGGRVAVFMGGAIPPSGKYP